MGIFSISGDAPTAEELAEARKQLRQCDKHFVAEGNKTFAKFGPAGIAAISDSFKVAAERTNQKPAWMFSVDDELPNCPHCGSQLKMPTATVCATCHRDVVPQNGQERSGEELATAGAAKGGKRKKAAA